MIFIVQRSKIITVPPSLLGDKLQNHISDIELEGTCNIHDGVCLFAGLSSEKAGQLKDGLIDDEGNARFLVNYTAIYFNLFPDEVADGIVEEIKPSVGIWLRVGPIIVFIDIGSLPGGYVVGEDKVSLIDKETKNTQLPDCSHKIQNYRRQFYQIQSCQHTDDSRRVSKVKISSFQQCSSQQVNVMRTSQDQKAILQISEFYQLKGSKLPISALEYEFIQKDGEVLNIQH